MALFLILRKYRHFHSAKDSSHCHGWNFRLSVDVPAEEYFLVDNVFVGILDCRTRLSPGRLDAQGYG